MVTIGITGTIGAGKGTIVDYLKTHGFTHYSAREFLLKEVAKRGLEPIRDNITVVANDLRRAHFPGFIISELLQEAQKSGKNAVIESIRSVGEIEVLRKTGKAFYLFAVDAELPVRYKRIKSRGLSTDKVSFEKFIEDEQKEYESKEPWSQNLKACIAEADFVLENNGTVKSLHAKTNKILANLQAKNA